jgi:hypothetical protein
MAKERDFLQKERSLLRCYLEMQLISRWKWKGNAFTTYRDSYCTLSVVWPTSVSAQSQRTSYTESLRLFAKWSWVS